MKGNPAEGLVSNWLKRLPYLIKKPVSIGIIIMIVIVFSGIGMLLHTIYKPVSTQEIIIRIKPGENTSSIARQLKAKGIIRSPFWFDILARLTDCDRKLKAGRYVFGGNVSLMQTINKIREGRSTLIHLTIPEGFSLYNTCKQMERTGIAPYNELMQIATDPVLVKKLTGFDAETLEGFLYPETYAFDIDLAPQAVFTQMTKLFFEKVKQAKLDINDQQLFYQNLTLASIVEQEAVMEDEKPLIAGVYIKRLKKGMKLESCPTVDYVLERQGIRRKRLLFSDLKVDSPYNTYQNSGLPPAPICNPSISALTAVVNPEITDYLYFFADFEGRNVFSKTFAEHLSKQKTHMKE
jgi:UPF0755 protein